MQQLKAKKNQFTIEQKIEIIKFTNKHQILFQTEIREHFEKKWNIRLPKSTYQDIIRHQNIYLSYDKEGKKGVMRIHNPNYSVLKSQLLDWIKEIKCPIIEEELIKKTKSLCASLNINDIDLKISHGWLKKFKNKFNIISNEKSQNIKTEKIKPKILRNSTPLKPKGRKSKPIPSIIKKEAINKEKEIKIEPEKNVQRRTNTRKKKININETYQQASVEIQNQSIKIEPTQICNLERINEIQQIESYDSLIYYLNQRHLKQQPDDEFFSFFENLDSFMDF